MFNFWVPVVYFLRTGVAPFSFTY